MTINVDGQQIEVGDELRFDYNDSNSRLTFLNCRPVCKSTHGRKRQAPKDDDKATAGSIQDVRVNVKRIHVQADDDVKRRYKRWRHLADNRR